MISRPVYIAIRNNFLDCDTVELERYTIRMCVLGDEILPKSHSWLSCFLHVNPEHYLHLRMACLTAREKEAYNIVNLLAPTTVKREDEGGQTTTIDSGEVVDAEKWEDEWSKGEGCWRQQNGGRA
jgi:hypothetical protein